MTARETLSIGLELSRSAPGQWMAIDDLVGQHGEGETPEAAVRDLMRTLRASHALLRERRGHLGATLSRQLSALEGFFSLA